MEEDLQSANGLQAFALGLNKRLADDAGRSGNLVYSPLSVYAALSLVAAGARERTLNELRSASSAHLHATSSPTTSVGSPIRPSPTSPTPAGRASASRAACGMTELFPSAPPTVRLLHSRTRPSRVPSTSAKRWEKPFKKERTTEDKFHRLDGTDVDVPFMRASGRRLLACHDGFKVLQLRYERGRPLPAQPAPIYSMCIFLPDARDGLWRLTGKITSDPDFLREHLPRNNVLVGDLRLPKFKITFSKDVARDLQELGVREAFDQGKADLSDMAEDGPGERRRLALQKIMHKAVIEVNEEGTEAAAVTAAIMMSGCSAYRPPRVDFIADHPFAFFVIEEVSGAILFTGHVVDPSVN
ncbi:unnamed protein product [Alopecurus aequalis]